MVIWGEANDISENNNKVPIKLLCNFGGDKKVNIVTMKLLHRLDLISSSYVNKVLLNFNR